MAVLSHRMKDGTDRLIVIVLRTLNTAEKNYSQLDNEGLAIRNKEIPHICRPFTIVTDHKPLIALFIELIEVPQMASPRIQRWAVTLCGYEYVYQAGFEHQNADGLNQFPLSEKVVESPAEEERVLLLDKNDMSLIKAEQMKKWTVEDPGLACLRGYMLRGWPERLDDPAFGADLKKQDELSVQAVYCGVCT